MDHLSKKKKYTPWISEELKHLIEQRNMWKQQSKYLGQLSNGNASSDLEESIKMFKYFRNRVNNKKKYDERKYNNEKFNENKHCPAKTWSFA